MKGMTKIALSRSPLPLLAAEFLEP
jgi:hypothetical protein